jgi:hypothetical protein
MRENSRVEFPYRDGGDAMKHLYDIFEQFSDHSSLWRESALGTKKAQRKLLEMVGKSSNAIYALDLTSGEVIRIDASRDQNNISNALTGEFKKRPPAVRVHERREMLKTSAKGPRS